MNNKDNNDWNIHNKRKNNKYNNNNQNSINNNAGYPYYYNTNTGKTQGSYFPTDSANFIYDTMNIIEINLFVLVFKGIYNLGLQYF